MKILHIEDGLPDQRVERAAHIAKDLGFSNYFLGTKISSFAFGNNIFEDTFEVNIKPRQRLGIQTSTLFDELEEIINELDPDIIHAHNIYNGRLIYELFPKRLVYDDHEFWSKQIKYIKGRRILKYIPHPTDWILNKIRNYKVPKWEKDISQNAVIIGSSKKIAEFHKNQGGNNVFYFPNMPLKQEIEGIKFKDPEKKLTSAFLGRDISKNKHVPYRNTTGLLEIFKNNNIGNLLVIGDNNLKSGKNVESLGFLPHLKCFVELSRAHAGLLGFRQHPALRYKSAQKSHMYVHAGCIPFLTPEQADLLSYLKEKAIIYKNFQDLKSKIIGNKELLLSHSHVEMRNWARENVVLDLYKSNLKEAYEVILN